MHIHLLMVYFIYTGLHRRTYFISDNVNFYLQNDILHKIKKSNTSPNLVIEEIFIVPFTVQSERCKIYDKGRQDHT